MAFALFLIIDGLWIKFSVDKFYKSQLGGLMRAKPDYLAGGIFYLLYILALEIFVVNPALGQNSYSYLIGHAALLGVAMYGTYDLTARATIKNWPLKVTIIDMIWGTLATIVVSLLAFVIFR